MIAFDKLDQAIMDAQRGGRPGPEQLLGATTAAQRQLGRRTRQMQQEQQVDRARDPAHRALQNPTAAAQAAAMGQKAEFWV